MKRFIIATMIFNDKRKKKNFNTLKWDKLNRLESFKCIGKGNKKR